MYNDLLAARYLEVLKDLDTSYLDRQVPNAEAKHGPTQGKTGLSDLFLPSVSEAFAKAKLKIMVIGSETAGWNVLKEGEACPTLPTYIQRGMAKHQAFFAKRLQAPNSRGYTFHNFMRSISERCGTDGLVYSNLFCFDWNGGSPLRQKNYFPTIEKYSELLIKAQIDVLEPNIIIFANGMSSVNSRQKFFPINGENSVCTNGRDYSGNGIGIQNRHLWSFNLYNRILCYRIHHPSARAVEAARARKFLLTLLPDATLPCVQ